MAIKRSSTTISSYRQLSPDALQSLAVALGYGPDCKNGDETPYIKYILSQYPGKGTLDDYVQLFVKVVEHFARDDGLNGKGLTLRRTQTNTGSIKKYIDTLVADATEPYFQDTPPSSDVREIAVTDTVLLILGSWTLMQSYFIPQRGEKRRILLAYCMNHGKDFSEALALRETLPNLLRKSGLLPSSKESAYIKEGATTFYVKDDDKDPYQSSQFSLHPSLGSVESLEIATTTLNAFKLVSLGAVRILWTYNLSRHMLLSKHAKKHYLELFALPSALSGGPDKTLRDIGISGDLIEEIQQSYANLFNPKKTFFLHRYFGSMVGLRFWCWCLCCSSLRLRDRQLRKLKTESHAHGSIQLTDSARPRYDPGLGRLMNAKADRWDQTEFENLWPRIIALDAHLSGSRPWSFWVIFRDRRDSVQFWTFLFGTVILLLTFVQVFLGIAQVVGSFN
ncbi:hypothetical protein K505DRAFT_123857 [Melanomma pulvis-pyrius CBS 109.77]|uniref:Uncharacterized protein n=1 Tax=Melanomma pulvis-pyrius CBS 109.77 TaxID=1314802 RepID=A0A6A6WV52_9PLEO|nr:hypothetical protein K505DRAFT_123857 [Melanomma pulvis-pyrius CBS 109.77]